MKTLTFLTSSLALASLCSANSISTSPIFGDNMVLQRGLSNNIWGKADAGEKIAVSFRGQNAKTTADKDGVWKLKIPTGKAGGPFDFKVSSSDGDTLNYSNVLVGDVWLCTGQSNMHWEVKKFDPSDAQRAKGLENKLRMFTVKRNAKVLPDGQADSNREFSAEMPWTPATPEAALKFSSVGFNFGVDLNAKLDIPIGLIAANRGGSKVETWMSRAELRSEASTKKNLEKFLAATKKKGKPPGGSNLWNSALYSSLIHPIVGYGITGAIWYQGESDTRDPHPYADRFQRMVSQWRSDWALGDFPFYYVQIAPFRYKGDQASAFNYIVENQTRSLALKNTGMAVINDIGEWKNIHPGNKRTVANRLANIALKETYKQDMGEVSSPMFEKFSVKGNSVEIRFSHANGLNIKGEALKNITLAGADKVFHPATAVVQNGTLHVTSDKVAKPVAVRYGWTQQAEQFPLNLFNEAGLPANAFRSDDW